MRRELNSSEMIRVLKALADPKRLRMLRKVARAGELSCGQLGRQFDLAQPTVSHHLKILHDAGCLAVRGEGQRHFISVNRERVQSALRMLPGRLAFRAVPRPKRARHPSGRRSSKLTPKLAPKLTPKKRAASKQRRSSPRKVRSGPVRGARVLKGARK